MNVSLKTRNIPKLAVVWALNVVVFSGISTGVTTVSDWYDLSTFWSTTLHHLRAGWTFAGLLTFVSVFNGSIPRTAKERLVFWPKPRPASRSFSYFMLKDSTINRNALEEQLGPLPNNPDEQNAVWAGWLNEFDNDVRVRSIYQLYLFARDWMAIAAFTLVVAGPVALWLTDDKERVLAYAVFLLVQCVLARWLGRVQGEQLVMTVISCKGSSLGHTFGRQIE